MGDEVTQGTLVELMSLLRRHMIVRFDPEREQNNFSIVIGGIRLGDTDDPEELLRTYMLNAPDSETEKLQQQFIWVSGNGGYKPGHFNELIIRAFFTADKDNYMHLAVGFPKFAKVYQSLINGDLAGMYDHEEE